MGMVIIQKISFEWQNLYWLYHHNWLDKKRVDSSNYAENFIHYVF